MPPGSEFQTSLLLPIPEAAARTPYTAAFLRQLIRKGKLHAEKIGRDWLITQAELDRFLEQQAARHEKALLVLHLARQAPAAKADVAIAGAEAGQYQPTVTESLRHNSSAAARLAGQQAGFAKLKGLILAALAVVGASCLFAFAVYSPVYASQPEPGLNFPSYQPSDNGAPHWLDYVGNFVYEPAQPSAASITLPRLALGLSGKELAQALSQFSQLCADSLQRLHSEVAVATASNSILVRDWLKGGLSRTNMALKHLAPGIMSMPGRINDELAALAQPFLVDVPPYNLVLIPHGHTGRHLASAFRPQLALQRTYLASAKAGKVLGVSTTQPVAAPSPGVSASYIQGLVTQTLQAMLAQGLLTGPAGPPGPSGLAPGFFGPNGMVQNGNGEMTSVIGGTPIVSYIPSYTPYNYTGGSLAGFTNLSGQSVVANTQNVTGNLTVQGSSSFGSAVFSGSLSAATSTLSSLTVSGSATFSGSTTIAGLTVTGLNPGLTLGSIAFQGSSALTQDNANLFYDSTNHRLGLGTTTPSQLLTVAGNSLFTGQLTVTGPAVLGTTTIANLTLGSALPITSGGTGIATAPTTNGQLLMANGSSWQVGSLAAGSNITLSTTSAGTITIADTLSPSNYFTQNGNAIYNNTGYQGGINSSTPTANLVVEGSSTDPTISIFAVASSSNSQILTVTAGGNVGIGTSTPATSLQVVGTSTTDSLIVNNNIVYPSINYSNVNIPSDFPNMGVTFTRNLNGRYSSSFNPDTYVAGWGITQTIYVDVVNGNDSTGSGTSGSPYKTVAKAMGVATSSVATAIEIAIKTNGTNQVFYRDQFSNGSGAYTVTGQRIYITTDNNSYVAYVSTGQSGLSWSKTGGYTNVYQATRSATANVVDTSYLDSYNVPLSYTLQNSIAAVDANDGSWYTSGGIVYAHQHGGGSPGTNVLVNIELNYEPFAANLGNNAEVFFRNLVFVGNGNVTISNQAGDYTNNKFTYYNTIFSHADEYELQSGGGANGYNNLSTVGIDSQGFNSVSAYAGADCFNHHYPTLPNNTTRRNYYALEFNNKAYNCGLNNSQITQNGFTSHEGTNYAVIGSAAWNTNGPVVAVVGGSYSLMIGDLAYDSVAGSGGAHAAYYFDNSGPPPGITGKAYLVDSTGSDSVYDIDSDGLVPITLQNFHGSKAPASTYAMMKFLPWYDTSYNGITFANNNVGVGTSTPGQTLTLQGTAGTDLLNIASPSGASDLYINSNGNVGIGTTRTSASLFIQVNGATNPFTIASTTAASSTYLTVLANGNVAIGTETALGPLTIGNGAYVSSGGTWTNASDRNLKENFATMTPADILQKIDQLPVTEWNYKNEGPTIKHIGPVAQDFYAIFQVGNSSTSISTIDPGGVALLGIQALDQKITALQGGLAGNASSSNLSVYNPSGFSGDSVGQAEILAGSTSVHVNFTQPYQYQPIVTADVLDVFIEHNISSVTSVGFTVSIPAATTTDITFNWHAFASPQAQLTVSNGSTTLLQLVIATTPPGSQIVVATPVVAPVGQVLGASTGTPSASTMPESSTSTADSASSSSAATAIATSTPPSSNSSGQTPSAPAAVPTSTPTPTPTPDTTSPAPTTTPQPAPTSAAGPPSASTSSTQQPDAAPAPVASPIPPPVTTAATPASDSAASSTSP